MLDRVIHKHLDRMDAIEDSLKEEIERIINSINVDLILKNPDAELMMIIAMIKRTLLDDFIPLALEEGVKLSQDIKKDGEIVVEDSNNPNLNKDLIEK